jgi:hypothetical protein
MCTPNFEIEKAKVVLKKKFKIFQVQNIFASNVDFL